MSERAIPKVVVVNDLVGMGRCAMTVQLPILSCLGVQVCPMATALSGAHAGLVQPGMVVPEERLAQWLAVWADIGAEFDGLLVGSVLTREQALQVLEVSERMLEADAPFVVAPVLGDVNRPYARTTPQMIEAQKMLASYATVIATNLTEACMLTKTQYPQGPCTNAQIATLIRRLLDIKPKGVVVTGIPIGEGMLANACALQGDDRISILPYREYGAFYPGAGDLFASTLFGRLVRGVSLMQAMIFASGWTNYAIERSIKYAAPLHEGIVTELILPLLATTGSGSPVDKRNDQTVQFIRIDE